MELKLMNKTFSNMNEVYNEIVNNSDNFIACITFPSNSSLLKQILDHKWKYE